MALSMREPNPERDAHLGIERAPKSAPSRGMAPPAPSLGKQFGLAKKNKEGLWEIESGASYSDGMAALAFEDALSRNEDLQMANPLTPNAEIPIPDEHLYAVANEMVNQHLSAKLSVRSEGAFSDRDPDTQSEFRSAVEQAAPVGARIGADVRLEGDASANAEAIDRAAYLQQSVADEALDMARKLIEEQRRETQPAIDSLLGSKPKVIDMGEYRQERESSMGMGSMFDSFADGVKGGDTPQRRTVKQSSYRKTSLG